MIRNLSLVKGLVNKSGIKTRTIFRDCITLVGNPQIRLVGSMVRVKQLVDFAQRKDLIVVLLHTMEGWDVKLRNAKKLCAKWTTIVVAQFGIYIVRKRQLPYVTFVRRMATPVLCRTSL
mmetsp:Transcript_1961/g.2941  ORF Transcript_1961/g.2941 Transcript_1961/m.2941 type:complete len:119 (-) Transcript_1961:67-423(-)